MIDLNRKNIKKQRKETLLRQLGFFYLYFLEWRRKLKLNEISLQKEKDPAGTQTGTQGYRAWREKKITRVTIFELKRLKHN